MMRVFVLLTFILCNELIEARTLKFVQALWRHGDRAPVDKPYPLDQYDETNWPRGWGQLTNLGMQQLKQTGLIFKDRYAGSFVDKRFNHKQVYVLSTDADRALVSAQSLLNGFFPPLQKDEKFEDDLNWQPIAVHSASPNKPDPLLRVDSYKCPLYDQKVQTVNKAFYKSLLDKYQKLFTLLESKTGFKRPITLEQVAGLNDLNRELAHGLNKQPDWLYQKWSEYGNNSTLQIVTELNRVLRNSLFQDVTLAYLRGGYLLGDWIERAKRVASQNQTQPSKMLLYSTHDGTVLALMNLLDVADGKPIAYGGSFIMEIFEDNNKYYVEFYYLHNKEITRICVAGCCGSNCLLNDFISRFESRTISSEKELEDICELPWSNIKQLEWKLRHRYV